MVEFISLEPINSQSLIVLGFETSFPGFRPVWPLALTRCDHLKAAQGDLSASRPGDGLMATLELIEEYLALDELDKAAQEIPAVCNLVERAGECRQVQERVSRLIQHHSRLTPNLIANLRRALGRARDRRLSNVVQSD